VNDGLAKTFGANLVRERKRRGLSQEELGFRAALHRTAIGQLERGERAPRVESLIKLAGSLEIDPGVLLTGLAWKPVRYLGGGFEFPDEDASL
jgi:transcriptional regulator with XRE-family HTH domain